MGTLNTSVKISPANKMRIAYHEAGHAIVGHYLEPDKKVTKINITPRGEAGGVTWYSPSEKYDPFILNQKELQSRIASALGGRLAEANASTGAASDFKQVSNLVEKMVKEYGMFSPGSKLAPMNYSNFETLSEAQKQALEYEMQVIVNQQSKVAQAIIKKQARLVEAVTEELLKNEVINGDRFLELVQAHGKS
jgi:cell division protease FtsH